MTTPAQYEEAMRALIMALADEHTQHPTGLKAALAIVREAREVRERVAQYVESEAVVEALAHTVDDVHPRRSHTADQADARIYCRHIANLIRTPEVPDAR